MQLGFSEIILSCHERRVLKRSKKQPLPLDVHLPKNAIERLLHLTLVEKVPGLVNKKYCVGIRITDFGNDYLMYLKNLKEQKYIENIKYIITTFIATLALVLAGISLAAQLHLIQLPTA